MTSDDIQMEPSFVRWVANTVADVMVFHAKQTRASQRKRALTCAQSRAAACQYDFAVFLQARNQETALYSRLGVTDLGRLT